MQKPNSIFMHHLTSTASTALRVAALLLVTAAQSAGAASLFPVFHDDADEVDARDRFRTTLTFTVTLGAQNLPGTSELGAVASEGKEANNLVNLEKFIRELSAELEATGVLLTSASVDSI